MPVRPALNAVYAALTSHMDEGELAKFDAKLHAPPLGAPRREVEPSEDAGGGNALLSLMRQQKG